MIRHLRILDFALASLLRQRLRTGLTLAVYAVIVFSVASVLFTAGALKEEAFQLLRDTPEVIVQRLRAGRHEWIPLEYGQTIATIRGVGEVRPRFWGYYYDPPPGATYTMMGIEEPDSRMLAGMLDGEFFERDDTWGCVIGLGVAEGRLLETDDIIPVKGADGELHVLRVRGIFQHDSQLLTDDLIIMNRPALAEIFTLPDNLATDLTVSIPNANEVETVMGKIQQILPDVRIISRDMILRTYEALFDWRGAVLLTILSGALAAFAILAWDRASSLSAEEKRKIGILKALGWEVSHVLELRLWEGFAISSLAFLIGILAAHLHVFHFGGALFAPLLKGWSVLFPDFQLQPHAEPLLIITVLFLTVIPYLAVTLVPAWKAAVIDPDQVLRG